MYKLEDYRLKVEHIFDLKLSIDAKSDAHKMAKYVFIKSCLDYGFDKKEIQYFLGYKRQQFIDAFIQKYKPTFYEKDVIKGIRRD